MQLQAIEAGGLTWYEDFDHRLSPATKHRGQLRITQVADRSLKTYRGSDQAEFTSGSDPPIVFGPWRPSCE